MTTLSEEHTISVVPHFELTPAEMQERMAEFTAYVRTQMVEGSDYGVIPNTGTKPTLLKPGAEKLCNLFGLTIEQAVTQRVERWEDPGLFVYEVETVLRSMRNGTVVAHGVGSCNSKESRYRWRQGQRLCPHCGKDAIIKGRAEYSKGQKGHEQGGWLCFGKKGGCGAKFADEDPLILGQSVERIENPDLFDQVNTILKMASKRSLVDAVLKATRASGLFTQDVEDQPREETSEGGIVPDQSTGRPTGFARSTPRVTSAHVVVEQPPAAPSATTGAPDGLQRADYLARAEPEGMADRVGTATLPEADDHDGRLVYYQERIAACQIQGDLLAANKEVQADPNLSGAEKTALRRGIGARSGELARAAAA